MREAAAIDVMQSSSVYLLYADNTERMADSASDIASHATKGGIFGVEKVEWIQQLECENYLKFAEMSMEDDYGMIDGIINNGKVFEGSALKLPRFIRSGISGEKKSSDFRHCSSPLYSTACVESLLSVALFGCIFIIDNILAIIAFTRFIFQNQIARITF